MDSEDRVKSSSYKTLQMTIVIDKANAANASKIIAEKLKKCSSQGNLAKHFGKLKRNIDGLKYQIAIRANED